MIDKKSKILITGSSGFVGTHLVKLFKKKGYKNLILPHSREYDLRIYEYADKLISRADYVIHLAANIGGIGYNRNYPADLFHDNLLMGLNLLKSAANHKIKKFVTIGTVCAYPKYSSIPFREDNLWDGYPESTNAPYGLAKKMLLVGSHAYRQQYRLNAIYLIPVNIYGPGDNFHPKQSHVIPALIRKFHQAKLNNKSQVTVWGTGMATREFLYVEDAARAIELAFEKYNKPEPVNIGAGDEISIADLVKKIANLMKFKGEIIWDKAKPDGQPRRLIDSRRAYHEFGYRARVNFDTGLKKTITWYLKRYD